MAEPKRPRDGPKERVLKGLPNTLPTPKPEEMGKDEN
jgi:hypothetical protein